ncbi:hypothetical protein [Aquabacterium sp. NJ1]|uniref:hypothetical protein n=1 Tax=Aquabacterium sp. NJ1 TaxID=1538295 RepID=UPI00126A6C74|nr:hypothetical protein [Aquabacterium sp. NJ1]
MYARMTYNAVTHNRSRGGYMLSLRRNEPSRRRIWTSVTSVKTSEDAERQVAATKRSVTKDCYFNITDFGSNAGPANVVEQIKFFKSVPGIQFKDCNVILNVASSGDNWQQRLELIASMFDSGDMPKSFMLVKGSQGLALSSTPTDIQKLSERYANMCDWTRRNGFGLTLVADISGHSGYVQDQVRRKIDLGATTINTHPTVDPSLVTAQSRSYLAETIANSGLEIILGQLCHTKTLYTNYSREGQGPRVNPANGADLYPVSPLLQACGSTGGWDALTELGVGSSTALLKQLAPQQVPTRSFQSRIGLGVDEQALKIVATLIENEPIDITEAMDRLLGDHAPAHIPLSEAILRSMARRYTEGADDTEFQSPDKF